MLSRRTLSALAVGLIAVAANAQVTIGPGSGSFVDISGTGTAIIGAGDDSAHQFTSTVGNDLLPAGNVIVTSNGYVASTASGPFASYFGNGSIGPTSDATLTGYAVGDRVVCPFWDDLYA